MADRTVPRASINRRHIECHPLWNVFVSYNRSSAIAYVSPDYYHVQHRSGRLCGMFRTRQYLATVWGNTTTTLIIWLPAHPAVYKSLLPTVSFRCRHSHFYYVPASIAGNYAPNWFLLFFSSIETNL